MFTREKVVEIHCKSCGTRFGFGICPECGCEDYIAKEYKRIYKTVPYLLFWEKKVLVSEVCLSDLPHDPNGPAEVIHLPSQRYY